MIKRKLRLLIKGNLRNFNKFKNVFFYSLIFFLTNFFCNSALADSYPWDSVLQKISDELTGKTAHYAILIAIALGGIGFALGEHGGVQRKIMGIIIGASCAVGAASLAATFGWL